MHQMSFLILTWEIQRSNIFGWNDTNVKISLRKSMFCCNCCWTLVASITQRTSINSDTSKTLGAIRGYFILIFCNVKNIIPYWFLKKNSVTFSHLGGTSPTFTNHEKHLHNTFTVCFLRLLGAFPSWSSKTNWTISCFSNTN